MSDRRLTVAVVGVGMIGSLHARAYQANPHTELVVVVDVNERRVEEVATELGVEGITDWEQAFARHRPDVVSVAVPEQHRYEPAVAAAQSGAHLLLEKPLAPTLEETDRLITAVQATGVTTMVNFILRADPRYLRVRHAVQDGRLGDLCTVFTRRRGTTRGAETYGLWTGLLISTAIHDLDAMRWILDTPIQRVYAEEIVGRGAAREGEDAVLATLRFANGAIGALETSWVLPPSAPEPLSAAFHLVGTGGGAWIDGSNHGPTMLDANGVEFPDLAHWPLDRREVGGALRASLDYFVDCLRTGVTPTMTLAEARTAQEVVAAIKASIRTRQPVTLPLQQPAFGTTATEGRQA